MRFIAERLDKAEVINYLCDFGFEDIDCAYAHDDVLYVHDGIPVVLSTVRLSLDDGQLPILDAKAAEIARLTDVIGEREAMASGMQAEIERLTAALAQANFKLSLTWPGVWQPVTEPIELIDPNIDDVRRLYINDDGTEIEFTCDSGELEGYFQLPEGYAICRKTVDNPSQSC